MPEQTTPAEPATPPEGQPAPTEEHAPAEEPESFPREYVEQLRKESAKYRTKATELEQELEGIRQSAMSDAEKAVAEAEARGRAEAQTQFGGRLVRSEFVAAAAKRNPGFDAAAVLDDLNLAKFVNDDGEPDAKAIAQAVERLIPAETGVPSFDGGPRTPAPAATGMNGLIRKATGRA